MPSITVDTHMQEIPDRASILEPVMVFPERFSRLGVGCSGKLPPIRLVGGVMVST